MGDSWFHLLFQRNSFVSWHLICSRARPLNESLCTPRACYIWGEVLYQGASVHALFPLKVLVEHIYEKAEASPLAEIFVQYNWDLGMMGQPAFAFAFAWTGMSASRGIETWRDCEIRDGDLQNSNLREAKTRLQNLSQTFPRFWGRAKIFQDSLFSRNHSIPLQVGQPACSYKHSNNFKMI